MFQSGWERVTLVVGILYGVIGVLFALPTSHVIGWRMAAWICSAALYAAHLGHEHFRLRNSLLWGATHVALAVALGGLLLALSATIHKALAGSSAPYSRYILALVIWPVITALPAFVVGIVAGALLRMMRRALS